MWRVRPEPDGRLWFSLCFVPMLLQAIAYAMFWLEMAGGSIPALGLTPGQAFSSFAEFSFWFVALGSVPALGLVLTAQRALPLFLVELFGPIPFGLLLVFAR